MAEVALHLQHDPTDPALRFLGLVRNQLLGVRVPATAGLAGPNGSEDGDPGEEPALGNAQPVRLLAWSGPARVMDFA